MGFGVRGSGCGLSAVSEVLLRWDRGDRRTGAAKPRAFCTREMLGAFCLTRREEWGEEIEPVPLRGFFTAWQRRPGSQFPPSRHTAAAETAPTVGRGGEHGRVRGTNTGADNGTDPVLPPLASHPTPPPAPALPSPALPSPTERWGAHPGWGPTGAALSPGSGTEHRPPPVLLPRGPSVRTGGLRAFGSAAGIAPLSAGGWGGAAAAAAALRHCAERRRLWGTEPELVQVSVGGSEGLGCGGWRERGWRRSGPGGDALSARVGWGAAEGVKVSPRAVCASRSPPSCWPRALRLWEGGSQSVRREWG